MRTLCSVVQGSTDINNFLYQTFCNIVSTSTDITLGTDREQLFRRLHKTRISQSIREEFALQKVWYKKLLISVDPWTTEQRVLISSGLLIKGSLVMLVSVDSRDAENTLPKDWSVNDIADVEVITGSALGIHWYKTWNRPWTVLSPSSQDSYKPVY
jgi:hypothetical protein